MKRTTLDARAPYSAEIGVIDAISEVDVLVVDTDGEDAGHPESHHPRGYVATGARNQHAPLRKNSNESDGRWPPTREKITDTSPQNTLVNLRHPTSEPFEPLHSAWHSRHLGPKADSEYPTLAI
jgi:hypothetical protein